MNVQPRGGRLVSVQHKIEIAGLIPKTDRAPKACGPPWLLGYILLNGRSYLLNEHFQWSIRDLDRASDTRAHFQDIGNPLISGQVYKRIATPVLLSKAEIAADLLRTRGHSSGYGVAQTTV